MATALAGDDLARSLSSPRSFASNSHRSWVAAASFREAWNAPSGVFNQSERQDDEEELRWAAIERLPKYDRLRKGVIRQVLDNGKVVHGEVDVTNLGMQDKKQLMESILKVVEEDNEKFLRRLRDRTDRMTLLLGPPASGKTTLMLALAGKLSNDLRTSGKVTYCGHELIEFVPQRTCAYISQHDLHYGEMTVRETLDFSGRCLGVGIRYELLAELSRREKEVGIQLDPEIDAFMKATVVAGQETSLVTDYVLKVFVEEVMELIELQPLRDALVGLPGVDGLSTEHRKRLTIAVELVANPSIIFMDEPTSGLDARAVAIVMCTMRNTVDTWRTVICTIHQPSIDIFEAFDEAVPGVAKINDRYSPATWMLEVIAPSVEAQLEVDFAEIFANSSLYQSKQQDLFNLLGAMYSAVLFLGSSNAMVVQPVVSVERMVFYRERAAGMYSALPYAFAQMAIEVIYMTIQTVIYSFILYSMIGFEWQVGKFFWFFYFILMCFIYFTMYGMSLVVLTLGVQFAAIIMSFFLSFWNLFAGFMIPRSQIPVWWRWYYWGSPVAWTLYGVLASQVGDINTTLQMSGSANTNTTMRGYLKDSFGMERDFLPYVAIAHVG
ncbi:hypothetical protein LWI29_002496 [Acer saccharum]|uniref:ABC transporter domain-containing protein n=1 Tax=Acer saccharum TaxID=4024 RepID=A0AA39S3D9_ACESA|nr:hypothetical protein LWI29_002496 [Acer saccharum]